MSGWLDRDLLAGPYLRLSLSEADYVAALAELGVKRQTPWILNDHSDATAHALEHPETGDLCILVCLRIGDRQRTGIEVAGLLLHEAVHVWQRYCEHIGEEHPGVETEAYAIQVIAQRLWQAFVDQQTNVETP